MRTRIGIIGIGLLLSMATLIAQNATDLYQRGLQRESAGDLPGAIQIFERIVRDFPSNRPMVARALVQLGEWSELLGRTQANTYYTRVVREFGDQRESSAEAQKRLTAREQPGIGEFVLALVDRDGKVQKLNVRPAQYRGPHVSPNGQQIAVEIMAANGQRDIWVYNLSGNSTLRKVTQGGNNHHPIWTPDGRRITFASDRGGIPGVFWQVADGTTPAQRLTTGANERDNHVPESWAPDGRTLSMTRVSAPGVGQSVWTVSLDNGAEPVLFAQGTAGGGVFSPDGRWIAYRENRRAGEQIYVKAFPATGSDHGVSETEGSHPVWSRNGRELFYRSSGIQPTSGSRLMALDIETDGDAPRWTNQRVLPISDFQVIAGYRAFDITPDGKRFLVILPAASVK